MKILIIEDKIYNYHLLCGLLNELQPNSTILGPLTSVGEAERFFLDKKNQTDIIISEIQLSDGLCFQALDKAPADIPIIFTTADDGYALKAFNYNSLSYILKPVDRQELYTALKKAKERLITDNEREELLRLRAKHLNYKERFIFNTPTGERVVHTSQIRYITSEQKNTFFCLLDGTMLESSYSLSALAEQLDPNKFMRVNRKFIIPAIEVTGFIRGINGKETLILKGKDIPQINISRDNKESVHNWLQHT